MATKKKESYRERHFCTKNTIKGKICELFSGAQPTRTSRVHLCKSSSSSDFHTFPFAMLSRSCSSTKMTSDTLKESLEITSFVFKTTCGELEIVGQSTAHAISSTRIAKAHYQKENT